MRKILIVEDDPLIVSLERDYLEANGFTVEMAHDGNEGLRYSLEKEYALILLDVMLPEKNGFEICREIRKTKDTPVILVTAKKEDIDKVRGFGLGADDYIVKPFSPSELVARVNAHISRYERLKKSAGDEKKAEQGISIRDLKILPLSRRVFVENKETTLTNKEFELLLFLASNPNIVFSKDKLFDRIWGMDAIGDTATVTVHINRLREKIEEDSSNPRYIETVWGAGYRFSIT